MYKEIFNKETNNDLQNTIQKTQQWATTDPTKNRGWTQEMHKDKQLSNDMSFDSNASKLFISMLNTECWNSFI
jgi:hypothetical protein